MVGMPMITACKFWCLLTLPVMNLLVYYSNSENTNLKDIMRAHDLRSDEYDVQT